MVVVDGGIVGLAVARELSRRRPAARLAVLVPFRGAYSRLRGDSAALVRSMIYPVADRVESALS